MWGFAPVLTRLGRDMGFVPFVLGSCMVLYVLTWLVGGPQGGGLLGMLSPSQKGLRAFGASGIYPFWVDGFWWTLLTASWLHANPIHILMNMMALRNVAPIVAEFYGASRMVIIYVLSGVAGFAASSILGAFVRLPFLSGAGFTVGASASIAGLIGAVFYYGHRSGSSHIAEQAKMWIIMFLIIGFVIAGIDNWAHIGGLACGYALSKFLDPLHPERLDHFVIALGLLIASAVAIIVNLIVFTR
jgi:rhomboid protease GluP